MNKVWSVDSWVVYPGIDRFFFPEVFTPLQIYIYGIQLPIFEHGLLLLFFGFEYK